MSPEQSVRLAGLPLTRVDEVPELIELKPPSVENTIEVVNRIK